MERALQLARIALALAGAFALGEIGYRVLTLPAVPDLAPTVTRLNTSVDQLNATLEYVNRPCNSKDKNGRELKPGVLCQVDKTVSDIGHIAITTQKQVQQSGALVDATTGSLNQVAQKVSTEIDALHKTTDAATETAQAATLALGKLNDPEVGLAPLLKASTASVNDLDYLLKNQAIARSLSNIDRLTLASAGTMEQWQGISTDTHKMTTHFEQAIDAPKPWYTKIVPVADSSAKVYVCFAFHVCY